ncbi:MAG: hypothetical protein M1600_05090 [Firmicutes bacterium]|nr:hypothetical protein [Bacillota bacterium]
MREDVSETRKTLEKHEHSMTAVWLETVQVFKLRSIVRKAGFEKEPGDRVAEIITLMMRLPFLLLKSVYRWYTSDFQRSPQYAALKDLFERSFSSYPW